MLDNLNAPDEAPCALVNGRILVPTGLLQRHAVLVAGGRIQAVVPETDARLAASRCHDLGGALLLPGFLDLQVNGGGGILFNDCPTVEGIRRIGAAHRRDGTTGFLPTLISDDPSVLARGIEATQAAIAAGVPGVLGIHLEGPFLNPERAGVHRRTALRAPDAATVALLAAPRHGITLLTLAPEVVPPAVLRQLRAAGLVLAAGHTAASCAVMQAALHDGVTGFTHLFNAMPPLASREPGVVGAALADPDSWCGLIVDGRHVDPVVLRIALRAKRQDRFMLVSDAMSCVGTAERSFTLKGRRISVCGDSCLDPHGTLAGTALTLAQAVRNAVRLLDLPLAAAVNMASAHPAAFLGLAGQLGSIEPGRRASLVAMDDGLNVLATWIDGEPVAGLLT